MEMSKMADGTMMIFELSDEEKAKLKGLPTSLPEALDAIREGNLHFCRFPEFT